MSIGRRCCFSLIGVLLSVAAFAQGRSYHFDIPQQSLSQALRDYGQLSGQEIIFTEDLVVGLTTAPLRGEFTVDDALQRLLEGTGLTAERAASGALMIRRVSPRKSTPERTTESAPVQTPDPMPQFVDAAFGTGSIEGRLLRADGKPASGVGVLLRESGATVTTDALGSYEFSALLAGTYSIVASAAGLRPLQIVEIAVRTNQAVTLGDLELRPVTSASDSGAPLIVHAAAATSAAAGVETVVVHARYIRRPNLDLPRSETDALPFIVYDRTELEKLGLHSVDDFTRYLPQASVLTLPTQNPTGQISAHNTINLRGLAAPNTLVLINGRRGVTGNAFSSTGTREQVDISTIPISAIERIEILPGTASAIYGASAVAGVVNVILRNDYRGTDVTLNRGKSTHGDAGDTKVNLVTGWVSGSGKTNVLLSLYQRKAEDVLNRNRGYIEDLRLRTLERDPGSLFGATPPAGVAGNIRSVSGAGLFGPGTANFTSAPAGYQGNGGVGPGAQSRAPFLPRAGQYNLSTDFPGLGAGGGEAVQPEIRDRRIDFNVTRALTSNTLAFFESFASERHVESPFALTHVDVVPANNPFNPFGQAVRVAYVPLDVVAGSNNVIESDEYRLVLGFEGRLAGSWRYTTDALYHRLEDRSHITATSGRGTGRTQALAQSDPLRAYNPFLDFTSGAHNSQAVIDAIAAESLNSESTSLVQGTLRVSGIAAELPRGSLRLTGGIEAREERSFDNRQLHRLIATGVIVQDGPGADRQRSVWTAYMESLIPLASWLEANVAVRHERFSDHGGTTNPQIAAKWMPFESFAVRASWGTGFVPMPVVLLSGNTITSSNQSLPFVRDPLRGNETIANATLVGGANPGLKPETSDSIGFGIIWQPAWLERARVTLDYFEVAKSDILVRPGPQVIVDNESLLTDRIARAPASPADIAAGRPGPINFIDDRPLNFTGLETSGIDVGLNYLQPTRFGQFTIGVNGTYVFSLKQQLTIAGPNLETIDKPIQFAPHSAIDLKGNLSVSWQRAGWSAGTVIRYLDAYDAAPTEIIVQGDEEIASSTEVDLTLGYQFAQDAAGASLEGLLSGLAISAGVSNLFDREPPFRGGNRGYSTFNDPRQRFVYLSVRRSF